ncbi:MAG TPA: ATP-binding SpoIIE family protein phosphatase [Gemmataceae bacterium]
MRDGIALSVIESSQVGEARRAVMSLADKLGFDPVARGKAALIVTESATNLYKHGRQGRLVLQPHPHADVTGIDVLALDKGPGIADLSRCFRDGYSTAGTPGTGLGAIKRQAAQLDIYSVVPTGTALLARLWPGAAPARRQFEVGSVCIPQAGEEVCGDTWAVAEKGRHVLVVLADGLGHGLLAAEASRMAVDVLHENVHLGPAALLECMHQALRCTRGAAVAVAEMDHDNEIIRYAGVGNIAGVVVSDNVSRSLMSHNGTVGHEARKLQEFTSPFPRGSILVMHSDGLTARWGLEPYPGLMNRDPSLIAGVLYRDAQRGRDDATVVVLRAAEETRG